MVQNEVGHQRKFTRDPVDIGPIAKLRINRPEIGHREPIVGCVGKERQNMDAVQCSAEVRAQEVIQQVQRLVRTVNDRIAIGDQQCVLFGPQLVSGDTCALAAGCPLGPEGVNDHA